MCMHGSSPRMRGAHNRQCLPQGSGRIIPADAGSTVEDRFGHEIIRDHPRGCGEHPGVSLLSLSVCGSSPRMRGAQLACCKYLSVTGIIPADAGSTPCWAARSRPCTDHPRGCGEHRKYPELTALVSGSSPRMRGALDCVRIAA